MPRRPWGKASAGVCPAQGRRIARGAEPPDSFRQHLHRRADALARARPVGEAGVACAIGQAVERRVAAKAKILGAGRADRPAATLLAEFEQRAAVLADDRLRRRQVAPFS